MISKIDFGSTGDVGFVSVIFMGRGDNSTKSINNDIFDSHEWGLLGFPITFHTNPLGFNKYL